MNIIDDFSTTKLSIAPWVATRIYQPQSGDCRAAISNELDHEFLVLENQSSILWATLVNYPNSSPSDLAEKLKYPLDEVTAFLIELAALHLIRTESQVRLQFKPEKLNTTEIKSTAGRYESGGYSEAAPGGNNLEAEFEFQDWASEHGYLWSASWEVTYRCNESCIHCFNPGASHSVGQRAHRKTKELIASEWRVMLQEMKEIGVFRLLLTGGEVFLHKEIFEIIEEARSSGFSVTIFTNGTLLDSDKFEKLRALYPHRVELSLYSPIAAKHDAITCLPGSYDTTIAIARQLVDDGIIVALKMCVMKETVSETHAFHEICNSIGCEAMVDMNISAGLDGAHEQLKSLLPTPVDLIRQCFDPKSPLFVGEKDKPHKRKPIEEQKYVVCGAGRSILSVNPEGNIYPCITLPINSGSVRNKGIKNVWQSSEIGCVNNDTAGAIISGQLSKWQSAIKSSFKYCGDSPRCDWCHKCPGMAMLETGDEFMPSSVNCRNAAARMIAYDLIENGISSIDTYSLNNIRNKYPNERSLWEPFVETRIPLDDLHSKLQMRGNISA